MGSDPLRGADLPSGYDESDPYDGEDLSTYSESGSTTVSDETRSAHSNSSMSSDVRFCPHDCILVRYVSSRISG